MSQTLSTVEQADRACTEALRAFLKTRDGSPEADEALNAYRAAVRAYDLAKAAATGTEPPRRCQQIGDVHAA